ncbi:hypothetical protein AURDEDRAFT_178760 [Auricularia subglabra TFB-10046 SS5]|uniref:Uncharacterized protein n=1 Tax=Auricularia subglabra (strain TFB-10046 / SS5) TaxID=717982 RepID=J0D0X1_AURST|nr:hypothetical protein AURDEDRAFT_178760 [Auricularia subglabra TFB-10046 SS5]
MDARGAVGSRGRRWSSLQSVRSVDQPAARLAAVLDIRTLVLRLAHRSTQVSHVGVGVGVGDAHTGVWAAIARPLWRLGHYFVQSPGDVGAILRAYACMRVADADADADMRHLRAAVRQT